MAIANKWSYLISFFVIAVTLILIVVARGNCAEVSKQTARYVAQQKLLHHISLYGSWKGSMTPHIGEAQAIAYNGIVVAYNFSVQPSGHILVAVDDELSPVLLYSSSSSFDMNREGHPGSVESWIIPELYQNVRFIAQHRNNPDFNTRSLSLSESSAVNRIADTWKSYISGNVSGQSYDSLSNRTLGDSQNSVTLTRAVSIGPLIVTAWGQDYPYNIMAPDDNCDSGYTLTGCVATAWAQLMRYWRWPQHGTGSHSYDWNGQTLSVAFDEVYDWDNMPAFINSSSGQAEKDAVSLLIYHAGIAAEMDFGCAASSSSAWAYEILDVYFGYKTTMQFHDRIDYADSEWLALFKSELDGDPPRLVIFSIFEAGSGGHEVVVDGYQNDGTNLVHINFGWEGYDDGFYNITSNFSAGGYTWLANDQYIVTGIEPANNPPVVWVDAVQTVEEGVRVQLTGSADDPEGIGIKSYLWTQISGPTVTLSGANTLSASFTSPYVNAETKLVFQLRADDINLAYETENCTITVNNTDGSAATSEISNSSRSSGGGGGGGCFILSLLH